MLCGRQRGKWQCFCQRDTQIGTQQKNQRFYFFSPRWRIDHKLMTQLIQSQNTHLHWYHIKWERFAVTFGRGEDAPRVCLQTVYHKVCHLQCRSFDLYSVRAWLFLVLDHPLTCTHIPLGLNMITSCTYAIMSATLDLWIKPLWTFCHHFH